MSTIRTNAAAEMLGVSPSTLRAWEKRYDYPQAQRTEGGHRTFELSQLEALAAALRDSSDPAAAIEFARQSGDRIPDAQRLAHAFASFEDSHVDLLLERTLAICSLERALDGVLLPSLEMLDESPAEQEFAARYAGGWVAAQKRLAAPASRAESVLIADGSAGPSADSVNSQALELTARRAGYRSLLLGVNGGTQALVRATKAMSPTALVLSGRSEDREAFAKAVYAVRSVSPEVLVLNYRGALPDTGASTVMQLGEGLLNAHAALIDALSGRTEAAPSHGRVLRSA